MAFIEFNNGITFNWGGNETLDALITETVDQQDLIEESKDLMEKLMFVNKKPLQKNEQFGSINPVNELPGLNENGTKEELERIVWPKKGFAVTERGWKLTESFLFTQWLRKTMPLVGAPESIQGTALDMSSNARSLIKSADLSSAYQMLEVLTKWFTISTANGAGSATPKGNALFATDHTIYKLPLESFSNKVADNGVLTSARLQIAIDLLKVARLENGQKVKQPKGKDAYKLFVSREGAVNARSILNTDGTSAGMYTGTDNNSSAINTFFLLTKINAASMAELHESVRWVWVKGDISMTPKMRGCF